LKRTIIVIFSLFVNAIAVGIGSSASMVKFKAVVGETSVDSTLQILNPDNFSKFVKIKAHYGKLDDGFQKIPGLNFISLEPETLYVGPKTKSERIRIKLNLPDSLYLKNRRFQFDVNIDQGKNESISTGISIPVLVETDPTDSVPKRCLDCGMIVYPQRLNITESADSITLFNWEKDTAKITVWWNYIGRKGWENSILIMSRIFGGNIPIPDTLVVLPNSSHKLILKPIAFPGKGKLFFQNEISKKCAFINITWDDR
jgi:hypothetical protein